MKIIDQYIIAIGEKLPLKGRKDIQDELKSLLLDDIENRFGTEPTEEEVLTAISDFGSPSSVAGRYGGENYVISPGLTDIYFLIFRILIIALSIAAMTGFFVTLFTGEPSGPFVTGVIKNAFTGLVDSLLSGIGMTTIIFIIISRSMKDRDIKHEERWSPAELRSIDPDRDGISKTGSIVSLIFLVLLLIAMNFFPSLISLSERSCESGGLALGSTIVPHRMKVYILVLSLLWSGTIIYHILALKTARKTRPITLFRTVLHWAGLVILMIMIADKKLYHFNTAQGISSMIGYRGIFVIVLGSSFLGLFLKSVKKLMKGRI